MQNQPQPHARRPRDGERQGDEVNHYLLDSPVWPWILPAHLFLSGLVVGQYVVYIVLWSVGTASPDAPSITAIVAGIGFLASGVVLWRSTTIKPAPTEGYFAGGGGQFRYLVTSAGGLDGLLLPNTFLQGFLARFVVHNWEEADWGQWNLHTWACLTHLVSLVGFIYQLSSLSWRSLR